MLASRRELDLATYERYHHHQLPCDGSNFLIAPCSESRFRIAGIRDHQRIYEGPIAAVSEEEIITIGSVSA
jgi:hypothetical protein